LPGHPANGSDTVWKRIHFGPNLEMRYRKPLTKKKMQQMEMICALAQSIMDEE